MNLLEFKGKIIPYKRENGSYLIAIKPICEALGVSYKWQLERLKKHKVWGTVYRTSTMYIPGDQLREMACLPEEYIYGWLLSINSDSEELIAYQRECNHVLFQHFRGTITRRAELYQQLAKSKMEIAELDNKLKDNEDFQRREAVKMQVARLWKDIKETSDDEQEQFS